MGSAEWGAIRIRRAEELKIEINPGGVGDAGPVAEVMNGAEEPEVIMVHEPANLIAMPAAAEAVGVIAVDPKGRRLLGMEGTKGEIFAAAGPLNS